MERKTPDSFYPSDSSTEVIGRWTEEEFAAIPYEKRGQILACNWGGYSDREAPLVDANRLAEVKNDAVQILHRITDTIITNLTDCVSLELQRLGIPDGDICEMHAFNIVSDIREAIKKDVHKTQFAVELSLEEALMNAYRHGNKCDPRKDVHFRLHANRGNLEFIVTDQGRGFDYENVPDPTTPEGIEKGSGRGIMLMKTFMDHMEYSDGGRTLRVSIDVSKRIAKHAIPAFTER